MAILIAMACIAWGMDNNFTTSILDIDAVRTTFSKGMIFGSVNLLIAAVMVKTWPSWQAVVTAPTVVFFSICETCQPKIPGTIEFDSMEVIWDNVIYPLVTWIHVGHSVYRLEVISKPSEEPLSGTFDKSAC